MPEKKSRRRWRTKSVALSSFEAYQYLQLQYVGSNKSATLRPKVAMGKLPAEIRAKTTPDLFRRTYYVKIYAAGKPLGVFADYRCTEPAEASLAAAIRELFFYPALEKGKPVGGVAELRLDGITL